MNSCNQNCSCDHGAGVCPGPCVSRNCGKPNFDLRIKTEVLPASAGTDAKGQPYAPKLGRYQNTLVQYSANGNIVFYDTQGIWTKIEDPEALEEAKEILEKAIKEETERAIDAENNLQANINHEVMAREADRDNLQANINAEVERASKAEENLQENINAEANARTEMGKLLQDNINAEVEAREAADNVLNTRIDEVINSPDVRYIVADYAALEAIDKATIGDQDYARVLQDETHNGEATYYQFDKATQKWNFVGTAGAYYTKTEIDNTFATIDALNEADEKIEANTTAISGKQDTLVSGTNIKTINGESVLGEGDLEIKSGAEVLDELGYDTTKAISQNAATSMLHPAIAGSRVNSVIGTFDGNKIGVLGSSSQALVMGYNNNFDTETYPVSGMVAYGLNNTFTLPKIPDVSSNAITIFGRGNNLHSWNDVIFGVNNNLNDASNYAANSVICGGWNNINIQAKDLEGKIVTVGTNNTLNAGGQLAIGNYVTLSNDSDDIGVGRANSSHKSATSPVRYTGNVLFGKHTYARGYGNTVIGSIARTSDSTFEPSSDFEVNMAVALGAGSIVDRDYTVSIGGGIYNNGVTTPFTRTISGVTAGTLDTDAVNVKQMQDYVSEHSGSVNLYDTYSTATDGANTAAFINDKLNSGSLRLGKLSNFTNASPATSIALGYSINNQGKAGAASIAIGSGVASNTPMEVYPNSIGIGIFSNAKGEGSTLVGNNSTISTNIPNGTAIGRQTAVYNGNSVALGAYSVTGRINEVSVGSNNNNVDPKTRFLANVTAGELDTDAVNVAQLNSSKNRAWAANTAYAVGELITNDGKLYSVTTDFTSGDTFDSTNLQVISGGGSGGTIPLYDEYSTATDGANTAAFINTKLNGARVILGEKSVEPASGGNAISIGRWSGTGTTQNSIAIGEGAGAMYDRSIAFGHQAGTIKSDQLSIGTFVYGTDGRPKLRDGTGYQVSGVLDPILANDAVNLQTLQSYAQKYVFQTYGQFTAYKDGNFVAGNRVIILSDEKHGNKMTIYEYSDTPVTITQDITDTAPVSNNKVWGVNRTREVINGEVYLGFSGSVDGSSAYVTTLPAVILDSSTDRTTIHLTAEVTELSGGISSAEKPLKSSWGDLPLTVGSKLDIQGSTSTTGNPMWQIPYTKYIDISGKIKVKVIGTVSTNWIYKGSLNLDTSA